MKGSLGVLARFDGLRFASPGMSGPEPDRPSIGFESVGPAATRAQQLNPQTLHLRFVEVRGLGFMALEFGDRGV